MANTNRIKRWKKFLTAPKRKRLAAKEMRRRMWRRLAQR